jgi:hypothetical protein
MPWWRQIGGQPRQGKRQGQAATRPDPPSSRKYHACKEADAKENASAIKDQSTAGGLCVLDAFRGRAKPDQYGHRIRRLGCGSARAARCEAFLGVVEPAGSPQDAHPLNTIRDHALTSSAKNRPSLSDNAGLKPRQTLRARLDRAVLSVASSEPRG